MQKPKTKKLFTFLLLLLLCSNLLAQETQLVNRLNNLITPIKTLKPDSSFEDIDFLKETLQDKEIIALGEVTHGTREVHDYKDRLIRYLVTNLNHKAIAFEADYSGLEMLDSYINGKIDTAIMSPNYQPLFQWLKAYNKTQSEQNKVHLYGLELRGFSAAIDKVLASTNDISERDKEILLNVKNTPFEKIDKALIANFRIVCARLPESLYSQMLIQLIDNYKNFTSLNGKIGFRDQYMANNAIALKEAVSDKKLIIWAHNGHVAKTSLYNKPAMGEYLHDKYGEKYYVIATDINKGYISIRKFIAKNRPISDRQPLYYPEVISNKAYEYYFKECKYKNFILDVDAASIDDQLKSFLTQPKEMRMIGSLNDTTNKKLSIANNFNMIVYFNETNGL
jgi:erythromycin esterase-like protein